MLGQFIAFWYRRSVRGACAFGLARLSVVAALAIGYGGHAFAAYPPGTYGAGGYSACQYGDCTGAPAGGGTVSHGDVFSAPAAAVGKALKAIGDATGHAIQGVADAATAVGRALAPLIRHIPKPVAYSFPYLLLGLFLLSILLLILQTAREVRRIAFLRATIERLDTLNQQKHNFLALASHYLRTPYTYITLGLEQTKAISEDERAQLADASKRLGATIEDLIGSISGLTESRPPLAVARATRPGRAALISPAFALPVLALIGLVAISDYVFFSLSVIPVSRLNVGAQALVAILAAQLYYRAARSHRLRREERALIDSLHAEQTRLDVARNAFITQGGTSLGADLTTCHRLVDALDRSDRSSDIIRSGLLELDSLAYKFGLLASLKADLADFPPGSFDLKTVVGNLIAGHHDRLTQARIGLVLDGENIEIYHNRQLVTFVLESVLDNAIKFSPADSVVRVAWVSASQSLAISIQNPGDALPPDYMDHIFEPFSRPGDATQFNYGGLGISLYLDKIILGLLGGMLEVTSTKGHGVEVSIQLPRVSAAHPRSL